MRFQHTQERQNELVTDSLESYKLLTSSIPVALFISTCLAIIMAVILYGQVPHSSLVIWFIVLSGVHIIRLVVFLSIRLLPFL